MGVSSVVRTFFKDKNLTLFSFKLIFKKIEHLLAFSVRYRFNSSNQKIALTAVISTQRLSHL